MPSPLYPSSLDSPNAIHHPHNHISLWLPAKQIHTIFQRPPASFRMRQRNEERQEVLELYLLFTLLQLSRSFSFFHLLLFPLPVFLKCDPGRWQRLVRGGLNTFEKRSPLISTIHHCLLRSATGSLQGAAELKGRGRCTERSSKKRRKEKKGGGRMEIGRGGVKELHGEVKKEK